MAESGIMIVAEHLEKTFYCLEASEGIEKFECGTKSPSFLPSFYLPPDEQREGILQR